MLEDDIVWLGVDGLHREIEKGSLSVSEIVETFLGRIERLDPELQAFSVLWPDRARATAARLDAQRVAGEPLGALHGVPIGLKDLCDVAGEPTRAGTTALGDMPAEANSEVVDRLEAAGAVILGKLKMTEGAFISHHPSVTPPKNPWNADRWTGISSSGSGVAVAAGLCTAALGTDTGGSIRFPSAACGLSGLKPTHGRVSLRGIFRLAESLDHIGPMARTVEDATRLFSVLCGFDPRDPWSLASNPIVATSSALVPRVHGTRIGVDRRYAEEGVHPEVVAAFREVLAVFARLGAEIVEVELPPTDQVMGAWLSVMAVEVAEAHAEVFATKADEYGAELRDAIELGLRTDGRSVARAWKERAAFTRRLAGCFDRVDAILLPVIPGLFAANTNLGDVAANPAVAGAVRFASPFNLSGSPSLTMSGGFDSDGAPIGFQMVGRDRDEALLMALGTAYQNATDWHERHPVLASRPEPD
jgi:amidase